MNKRHAVSRKGVLLVSVLAGWAVLLAPGSRPLSAQATGSGTVVVANMSDNTVTIVDAASWTVLATLPTGPAPHEVAVTGDGRTAVVTNYGDRAAAGRSLTIIDLENTRVQSTIELGIYERPHGVAVLPGDSLVAVTSEARDAVILVHLDREEVVAEIPTEAPASHMLAMDAGGTRLFTTNITAGTVSEIDPTDRSFVRHIEVAAVVEGIAAAPDATRIWVGSNRERTVSVVDIATGSVIETIEGFGFPYRMAVSSDGNTAVLVDPALGEVRIVDASTFEERHRVEIPAEGVVDGSEFAGSPAPEGVTLSRDGRFAYVSLQGRNQVAAIELATGTLVGVLDTGVWPDGIGYSPLTRGGDGPERGAAPAPARASALRPPASRGF